MWSSTFASSGSGRNDNDHHEQEYVATGAAPPHNHPSQYPPPPPPPPPPPVQQQQQQYPPPPPVQQQDQVEYDDEYNRYPNYDDHGGALTSTINLVTSAAASVLFRTSSSSAPTPPTTETDKQVTSAPPPPPPPVPSNIRQFPPPLEPESSMLGTATPLTGTVTEENMTTTTTTTTGSIGTPTIVPTNQQQRTTMAQDDNNHANTTVTAVTADTNVVQGQQSQQQQQPHDVVMMSTGTVASDTAVTSADGVGVVVPNDGPYSTTTTTTMMTMPSTTAETLFSSSAVSNNNGHSNNVHDDDSMGTGTDADAAGTTIMAGKRSYAIPRMHTKQQQHHGGVSGTTAAATSTRPPPTTTTTSTTITTTPVSSPSLQPAAAATTTTPVASLSLPSPSNRSMASSKTSTSSPRFNYKLPPPLSLPRPSPHGYSSSSPKSYVTQKKKWGGFKVPPPISTKTTSNSSRSSTSGRKPPRQPPSTSLTTVPSGITTTTGATTAATAMPSPMASPIVDHHHRSPQQQQEESMVAPAPSPSILEAAPSQPLVHVTPSSATTTNAAAAAGRVTYGYMSDDDNNQVQVQTEVSPPPPPIMPQLDHDGTATVAGAVAVGDTVHVVPEQRSTMTTTRTASSDGATPNEASRSHDTDVVVAPLPSGPAEEGNAPMSVFVSPQPPEPPVVAAPMEEMTSALPSSSAIAPPTVPIDDGRLEESTMSPVATTLPPPPPPPPRDANLEDETSASAPPLPRTEEETVNRLAPSATTAPSMARMDDTTSQQSPPFVAASHASEAQDMARSGRAQEPLVEANMSSSSGQVTETVELVDTGFDVDSPAVDGVSPEVEVPESDQQSDTMRQSFPEETVAEEDANEQVESQPPLEDPSMPVLPLAWSEEIDPTSGQTYYYNSETGESRWERPALEEARLGSYEALAQGEEVQELQVPTQDFAPEQQVEKDEGMEEPAPVAVMPQEEETSPSPAGLPEGWSEEVDPSTGMSYYFNAETGATTWERPSLEDAIHEEEPTPIEDEVDDASASGLPTGARETTEAGESTIDVGSVRLTNGAEESKEELMQSENEQSGPEAAARKLSVDDCEQADALPSGWSEHIDPSSGKPYYVNSAENVTSWERPSVPLDSASSLAEVAVNGLSHEIVEPPLIARSTDQNETDSLPESTSFVDSTNPDDKLTLGQSEAMQTDRQEEVEGSSMSSGKEADVVAGCLPEDWQELVDPNSGRVYYYNAADGTSTWDRPNESGGDRTSSVSTSENEHTTDENELSNADTGNPPESTAPKSAESWNFVSSQTSFDAAGEDTDGNPEVHVENSDGAGENMEQLVEEIQTDAFEAPELPSPWKQLVDPASGNPYYFNELTQETSWQRPSISEAETEEDGAPSEAAETPPEEQQPSAEEKPVEPVDLARKTVEHTAVEGKEKDESLGISETTEPQLKVTSPEGAENVQSAAEPETSLPSGWVTLVDSSSGMTYYLNETDGTTTWEPPIGESKAGGEATTEIDAESENLVSEMERERPDDESGRSDGSCEKPLAAELQSEFQKDVTTSPSAAAGLDDTLPAGWIEMIDPSSGNPYYVNEIDNTTTWERPVCDIRDSADEQKVDSESKGEAAESVVTHTEQQEDVACDSEPKAEIAENMTGETLPAGWIETLDPSSGKLYYFNETENVTTWERPKSALPQTTEPDEMLPIRSSQATEASETGGDEIADGYTLIEHSEAAIEEEAEAETKDAQAPLPPGWLEMVDEVSGDSYYLNEAENITTWDRPSLSPSGPTDVVESEVETSPEEYMQTHPQETMPQSSVEALPLPEGWSEVVDPGSGQIYYFNEDSGETTWDRPSVPQPNTIQGSALKTEGTARSIPARVFATFGFGGRLCVWKAKAPTTVAIYRVGNILKDDPVVVAEQKKRDRHVAGPLNSSNDDAVLKHIESRASSETTTQLPSNDLLMNLVLIAAKSNGRLRSDDGVQNPSSPEASIVHLLLNNGGESSEIALRDLSESTSQDEGINGEVATLGSLKEVEQLLLRGKREEAVQEALASRNFAMAFLVASMCDRTTFQNATKQYADEVLSKGRPLHTLAMLFSGQLQPPIDSALDRTGTKPSIWDDTGEGLSSTWRQHLAATISNRTLGWDRIVLALGDHLLDSGLVSAAHFCYMACGCSVTSLLHPSSRMCLVGCDHVVPMDAALLTPEGVAGYERTEAYEWAKRRGNPNAAIPSFQPFKLLYAMLLADLGLENNAKLYVESIRQCCGLDELKEGYMLARNPATVWSLSVNENFICSLNEFEERLGQGKHRSQFEQASSLDAAKSLGDGGGESTFLPAQPPPTVDNAPPTKETKKEKRVRVKKKSPRRVGSMDTVSEDETFQPEGDRKEEDVNATFLSAQSNLLDTSAFGTTSVPPVKSDRQVSVEAASKKDALERRQASVDEPSQAAVAAPPSLREEKKTPTETDAEKKEKLKKSIKPPPNSAPALLGATKAETSLKGATPERAPSSDKKMKWGFGITKRMNKWLNPDATTADIGEKMKAYYDEDRKVWVFPGEDPAELAKPIGPPPTTIAAAGASPEQEKESPPKADAAAPATPTDPIAAMMAPPQRAASFRRSSSALSTMENAGVARYPGMMPLRGGAQPSSGQASPFAGGGLPPQYAVFKPPPPAPAANEKDDKTGEESTE